MTRVWIGVDVGGTKVLAAVVGRSGRVKRTARRTTPGRDATPQQLEDALTEAVREAAAGHEIAGVGLAAAGNVDGERVRFCAHLPWRDDPVRPRLESRWRTPVVLENDATAAAYAEATLGAGAGYDDVVVVTLGTGLGGGIILGGRLHRGNQGMAGEFGHMRLVPDGLPCPCGGVGCWEQYCSGTALGRAARAHGVEPSLTGPGITEAARAGDPAALAAFDEVGRWLGRGLAALVDAFDPACVVIGGGLSEAGDLLLEPARRVLAEQVVGAGHRDVPPVVAAALGPEAGVIGAAALVRLESGRRVRAGRRTPTARQRWMTIRARNGSQAPARPRDGRGRARRR